MISMRTLVLTGLLVLSHPSSIGQIVGAVAGGFGADALQGCKNLPYSAVRKTTLVQKLADGTTITQQTSSREARDSQGRTMTEMKPLDFAGMGMDLTQISVTDPVAHTWTMWTNMDKGANVMHMPGFEQLVSSQSASALPSGMPTADAASGSAANDMPALNGPVNPRVKQPEVQRVDLGEKTVNGIDAHGVRETTTMPVGMIGNDRPIVTVSETWTSPALNIVVLQTTDDPRSGLRTEELTDLSRAEPDASLFQVPAGYTIREQDPNQQK